eukprot:376583-Amphidinium_carterae.1
MCRLFDKDAVGKVAYYQRLYQEPERGDIGIAGDIAAATFLCPLQSRHPLLGLWQWCEFSPFDLKNSWEGDRCVESVLQLCRYLSSIDAV